MSHEFLITDALGPYPVDQNPYEALAAMDAGRNAHFQGYGDGALYKAFKAEEFYAQVSGSFGGREISKKDAEEGLQEAIRLLANYPDPKRSDDLKRYLAEVVEPAPASARFYIHFF